MTANKGAIGHAFGAAGVIESIFAVKSLKEGLVPKILNLNESDVEADINMVMKENQKVNLDHMVKNSFGMGGVNVSLVFSKFNS